MFEINGIQWQIEWVSAYSSDLMRSNGSYTVGMTDWDKQTVYLAKGLKGAFLRKVLAHELVHCFCFSYSVYIPVEQEEFMANWVATYGDELMYLLDDLMNILKKAYIA